MTQQITVACKLPHGLELRLFKMVKINEPTQGGYRTVNRAEPVSNTITIKGYLEKYRIDLPPAARGAEYALTHNVDKEFFDEWLKQNADHDAVKNKLIFASENLDTVTSMISENASRRNGLEPINPANLPKGIQTATKVAA
ncbi:hypothetical protein AB9E14_23700 [Rhizobium leguminosarum]|uniref:hypothetical protein n=1 Tax=Rhizobium leguminosarum TaxID=384 RepID=UPI003F959E95